MIWIVKAVKASYCQIGFRFCTFCLPLNIVQFIIGKLVIGKLWVKDLLKRVCFENWHFFSKTQGLTLRLVYISTAVVEHK